jgi:hypothetical protein
VPPSLCYVRAWSHRRHEMFHSETVRTW